MIIRIPKLKNSKRPAVQAWSMLSRYEKLSIALVVVLWGTWLWVITDLLLRLA